MMLYILALGLYAWAIAVAETNTVATAVLFIIASVVLALAGIQEDRLDAHSRNRRNRR